MSTAFTLGTSILLGQQPTAAQLSRGKELYLANCATCHGQNGDGKGEQSATLDRPPRSFQAGGFSFGNTPLALFRTISQGIPGTPMPSFASAFSEQDRYALAHYIRSLGPPSHIDASGSRLTVNQLPLIVRGKLPAIAEGANPIPRGLLVGTTDGLSFEYRVDDVRLLGIRQGAFVDRKDWTGRGGDALQPLGHLIDLRAKGKPKSSFSALGREWEESVPLQARFAGTSIQGKEAFLHYRLLDSEGHTLAEVDESPSGLALSAGSGYRRRYQLRGGAATSSILLRLSGSPYHELKRVQPVATADPEKEQSNDRWWVRDRGDGSFEVLVVKTPGQVPQTPTMPEGLHLMQVLHPNETVQVEIWVILTHGWTEDLRDQLLQEIR